MPRILRFLFGQKVTKIEVTPRQQTSVLLFGNEVCVTFKVRTTYIKRKRYPFWFWRKNHTRIQLVFDNLQIADRIVCAHFANAATPQEAALNLERNIKGGLA